jgi:parvulin-like peptidyl-prolyl isomerase
VNPRIRRLWIRSAPWAAGAFALLLWACGGEGTSGTWVVRVDGAPIERHALDAAVAQRLETDPDASRAELVDQELVRLVEEELVLARASELGVQVSDGDLAQRLRTIHAGAAAEVDPDYREQVRRQMKIDRAGLLVLAERAQASDADIAHAFEEQRERFAQPERVRVRQIVVEDPAAARRLLARLAEGADFATLAAENSLAPEAPEGGLLPPYARGEMPDAFDAAFGLAPGALSDIVESPYGFHVFRLEERIAAREATLEAARETLRAEIESQRLDEARRDWIEELRRSAQIEVNHSVLETLR